MAAARRRRGHEASLARQSVEQPSQQAAALSADKAAQRRHGAEHAGRTRDPDALTTGSEVDPLAIGALALQRHRQQRMRREHGNRRAWARVDRLCRHLVLAPVNARPRISGDFAEDARPASQIAAPSDRVGRESAAVRLPASASAVQPAFSVDTTCSSCSASAR